MQIFPFNPIPTGCCHVTLINGLILPMAGRNRVRAPFNMISESGQKIWWRDSNLTTKIVGRLTVTFSFSDTYLNCWAKFQIPYARHYKPRLVYFFTQFQKTIYVLWPLVWCMACIQERPMMARVRYIQIQMQQVWT